MVDEKMIKVKTSTLSGTALDWVAAIAKGIPPEELYISGHGKYHSLFRYQRDEDGALNGTYMTGPDLLFSSKYESGGPIIFQEKINTICHPARNGDPEYWEAIKSWPTWTQTGCNGPTPLIAGMRCFAISKLGDEVEIPAQLFTNDQQQVDVSIDASDAENSLPDQPSGG
jgi:hypothetical protein